MIDIAAVRSDTPSCERFIHFNNCGSSPPPKPVVDTVVDYLRLEAEIGGYAAQAAEAAGFQALYDAGAEMLNCGPDELASTSGASEAWWRAFLSIPLAAGDRVLIGRTEYVSNALALIQAADRGVHVEVVPDDEHGQLDVEALADMLDERVKLVCVTTVAMANGMVNPMIEIGRVVRDSPARLLVDACQAVGQLPVDVAAIGCDFLSFTGRKFVRGPRGTGMLYVRRDILEDLAPPPFIDGWGAHWDSETSYSLEPTAKRFELVERSYGAQLGLGRALAYANSLGLDAIERRIGQLAELLRTELGRIEGVRALDTGQRRCGIVSFDIDGVSAQSAAERLESAGIYAGSPAISHSRYDLGSRQVEAVVRAGIHYFNTEEEVARFVEVVADLVAER